MNYLSTTFGFILFTSVVGSSGLYAVDSDSSGDEETYFECEDKNDLSDDELDHEGCCSNDRPCSFLSILNKKEITMKMIKM